MSSSLLAKLQTALGDAYRLERELGGGGMSRVFVAREVALDREVVVKTVAPELTEGLSTERFAREVKLAARLQHANIVPVLTAGAADGVPYYTMPFVRGESLRARLLRGEPLPLAESLAILRDVARALAYAHREGIVHRDIKPENILLSGGAALVADFGIAKALATSRTQEGGGATSSTLTSVGSSLGTPAYMAPEQASGDPGTDHRADVYAFGMVAWELIAGVHPFAGKTKPHALIAAQIGEMPAPVSGRRADVPPVLERLVMRCLAKDPASRPANADEILRELDTVATPVPAPHPERITTRSKPDVRDTTGRRRRTWPIVGALAAAVVIAAFLIWMRGRAQSSRVAPAAAKSLAVLPFSALGGDTANTYFAEGIADELTTALARLPGLRLAGRASAARVKQRGASPQEIGDALKVSAVLDGTVRRAGDRIRVSVELTSAANGQLLWKESYERELKDVFAVQDELARAIAGALQMQLGGAPLGLPRERRGTENLEAYDLYLRGLQLYRRRGTGLAKAEQYLKEAIAKDSTFGRAYATLASVLLVEPYYFDVRMAEELPRARAAAERAVAIDATLPEAHLALGHAHIESFEWRDAEEELRRGLALDPSNSEIAFRLGFMLLLAGRNREGIAPLQSVKSVDPFYGIPAAYLAWALALVGQKSEAIAEAQRAFEIDSTSEAINTVYSQAIRDAGLTAQAVEHSRRRVKVTDSPRRLGFYALVLASGGARADAEALERRVQALPPRTQGRNSALSYIYLALGDTARALSAMESAAAGDGDLLLTVLVGSPAYDPVRASPRFAAVLRRFNLDVDRLTAPDGGRSR